MLQSLVIPLNNDFLRRRADEKYTKSCGQVSIRSSVRSMADDITRVMLIELSNLREWPISRQLLVKLFAGQAMDSKWLDVHSNGVTTNLPLVVATHAFWAALYLKGRGIRWK